MNAKQRMRQRIEKHGNDLNAIFNTGLDPIKLCKKLHALEMKANRAATCMCNTNTLDRLEFTRQEAQMGMLGQATEAEQDAFFDAILDKVDKILNFKAHRIPVFINHDPRGYTLKIKSEYVKKWSLRIYQDWGGFGIIAPEFDGKE